MQKYLNLGEFVAAQLYHQPNRKMASSNAPFFDAEPRSNLGPPPPPIHPQITFPESDDELLNLLAVKITQCELVRDRGYQIPATEQVFLSEEGLTIQQFRDYLSVQQRNIWNNNPQAPLTRPRWLLTSFYYRLAHDDIGNQYRTAAMVYYGAAESGSKSGAVNTAAIQQFVNTVTNQGRAVAQNAAQRSFLEHAILIVPTPLNSDAGKYLAGFSTIPVTVYQDENLMYNPVTHVDTAIHVLLSPQEALEVKRSLHVTDKDFMIMESTDPVSKYYGWRPGSLVRIIRNDDEVNVIVDHSINYRIVV